MKSLNKIFNLLKLKIFRFVNRIFGTTFTFSADGEDIIIRKFLSGVKKGFYVDLGAHNHKIGSNTYYFYLLGWSGVCVDPLPGVKKKFTRKRPKDTFLEKAVVPDNNLDKTVDYHFFNNFKDNSTTSIKRIDDLKRNFGRIPSSVIKIDTITISELVKNYIGTNQVSLLNIDIEGGEFEILSDLLRKKVYPWIICVEEIGMYAESIVKNSSIFKILNENSYLFVGRTFLTSIYVNINSLDKLNSPYINDLIIKK